MTDLAGLRTTTPGVASLVGTAMGTVTGSTAPIEVGGVQVTAQVLRGLTLARWDPVLITRHGATYVVVGKLAATTPAAPLGDATVGDTSPDAPPVVTTGTLVCPAVETRSYRGSWRDDTDDVYQGEYGGWGNHQGCAFYGSLPRSLAGATVTGSRVLVRRLSGGTYAAQTTTLRLVSQATRPAGAPTLGSSTTGPSLPVGGQTEHTVPTSWAQAMVDGTAGALAIYTAGGSPYVRTAGRGSWGSAWTLIIDWRR